MYYNALHEIGALQGKENYKPEIIHLINPFQTVSGTEHDIAQTVTFNSICKSLAFSKDVKIQFFGTFPKKHWQHHTTAQRTKQDDPYHPDLIHRQLRRRFGCIPLY